MLATTTSSLLNPHKWVDNYADYLYAYALARLNDEEQARDLVQEVFLAALERADMFEGKSTERTWLTAILKNKIIDTYRRRSSGLNNVTIRAAEQEQEDFFYPADGHWREEHRPKEFGIEDHDPLHNKEFNLVLQQCLKKLPALWLAVFTMKHMEDESTENICTELKVTSANFWVIIHRTKLNLRACLQKTWI
ncbi:sigma-70 family RNA polymerase sigma factor [Mucilaginibacter sp. UR6-11]|uniref:sigma-70 family RNA polymerase sigma factor n=1 Tax=Mucilaginibacter sp. UR6-11 TaxID=1435644 RepID=UPI001E47CC84|nr:sigma-70 family RNA polymerase sigma factor [Mucilaginibacter sp. UR6-11]MCC8424443.1 sigma-70 family RNA polymerase sigma factor [Mucilaginibacter sp. UR6-11]